MDSKTPENDSKSSEESEEKPETKKPSLKSRLIANYYAWRKLNDEEYERLTSKESIWRIVIKFFLPFWLAIAFSFALYVIFPDDIDRIGKLFVVYFFNPAGMEFGVTIGIGYLKLNPFLVVGFMLIIDSLTAMFLVWNFDYTRMLPLIGRLVRWVHKKAEQKIKKSRRFERGRFWGLIVFVLIPAYGTGAILGGIVGKLLKMEPWEHWIAIFIGSTLRLTLLALITLGVLEYIF
ncbi:MAG: small multi-drug export protein [Thermoplasmata archaeon]|nr:MAG: small multi-drug export protein [Thermoplasmata archaeon]